MADRRRPSSLQEFDSKLARLRGVPAPETEAPQEGEHGSMRFGDGIQVGIELIAGVAGGALVGWALDRWLETGPLLLVVFFLLGAAAGMLNAYRHLRRYMRPDDAGA